jgi:hypothetical protein
VNEPRNRRPFGHRMGNKARVKCKVKEKGKAMGRDKGKANAKGKVGAKAVEDARLPSDYPNHPETRRHFEEASPPRR